MEKELKILTANVTIQLITVDGKRMTKAVFDQIQTEFPFNENFEFTGKSYLGYVVGKNETKYLLWVTHSGDLRKIDLIDEYIIEEFRNLDFSIKDKKLHIPNNLLNHKYDVIFNQYIDFYQLSDGSIYANVHPINFDKLQLLINKVYYFLTNLKDQLYIAI